MYKNLKWSANVGVWQHALRGFIHEDICWNAKFKSPAKSAKCTHVWLSNKNEISLNTRERRELFLRSNNLFNYIHTIGVWNWQPHLLVIVNCPIHTTAGRKGSNTVCMIKQPKSVTWIMSVTMVVVTDVNRKCQWVSYHINLWLKLVCDSSKCKLVGNSFTVLANNFLYIMARKW